KLKCYLNRSVINMSSCPIKFWNNHPNTRISAIANRHFTLVGTSVPSECLFSKAGIILNEARNRLSGKHLNQLLFLNSLSIEDWYAL
ncbi:hypothetical protein ALC56_02494, partial [Trachymyrmex septentrionalis]